MKKFYLIFICVLFKSFFIRGQVISWSPEFPSIHDTITITYNSSLGNGALANTNTIYAHTGVINKYSSSMSDWKNTPLNGMKGRFNNSVNLIRRIYSDKISYKILLWYFKY